MAGESTPADPEPVERDEELLAKLSAAPLSERRRLLLDHICRSAAAFIALDDDDEVAPQDLFLELGFDSLRAVDFKILLEGRLGCALPATVLFDCPTPESLVDYLRRALEGEAQPAGAAPARRRQRVPSPEEIEALDPDELRALAQRQSARLAALDEARAEPIAIVGMACRFPGGAKDPEAFWRLQLDGVDAIEEVPASRWPIDEYFDPDPAAPGRMYLREGGFVGEVETFDAAFFGISPREAVQLDPQQRLLLEVTWEAIERAGIAPEELRGSATGVFVGTRGAEYFTGHTHWDPEDADTYYATGNAVSTLSGRISYVLGLHGPCFAVDTACSSSLVALHNAVQSLRRGECSAALAGGVNLLLDPFGTIAICKASMLSPGGRCKTFDASADGYVRAEGCGVIVLKRLSRARADGDRVLAVIRGTAVNQDGAGSGLTVPNGAAQEAVIRQALADGGLEPGEVDYVEAHGTGTSLGDPIEVAALDAVFGPGRAPDRPLLVGSVKTNIGHTEPAAGIAGLIRAVQVLQSGVLPGQLHLNQPSPHIPWSESVVRPLTETATWPETGAARAAGVSSFGFSGTNAHVVLAQAPEQAEPRPAQAHPVQLYTLSARSEAALTEQVARHRAALVAEGAPALADACRTVQLGRGQFPYRLALLARSREQLAEDLAGEEGLGGKAGARPPKIGFLFTGQGSQYPGMGLELYGEWSVFRAAVDRCAELLAPRLEVPLLEVLWGGRTELLGNTAYTQPALFTLGIALAELWGSWGVHPTWVAGHSIGEVAAAHLAGVFDLEQACELIAARGRLMVERTEPGSMLAVSAPEERLRPYLEDYAGELCIAAHNAPGQLVISGTSRAVAQLGARLEEQGLRCKPLEVSHAFHSPLMESMLADFEAVARGLSYRRPQLGFVSNLDPGPVDEALASPDYWVRHVREPVRFTEGIGHLARQGCDALVEIGPAPVLLGLARRGADLADIACLPSLRKGQGETPRLLESLAELWVRGAPVDWAGLQRDGGARKVLLPTYPFQRERYWLAGRSEGRGRRPARGEHPFLGRELGAAVLEPGQRLFASVLREGEPAWLGGHRALERTVVPAAAFLEWGLAAGSETLGTRRLRLERVDVSAPLVLSEVPGEVQLLASPAAAGSWSFELFSREQRAAGMPWTRCVSGQLSAGCGTAPPKRDLDELRERCPENIDVPGLYGWYDEVGLHYGPGFRALCGLWRGESECLAQLRLPEDAPGPEAFALHPILLDACFQSCATLGHQRGLDEMYLPIAFEALELYASPGRELFCHARLRSESPDSRVLTLYLELFDDAGRTLARVEGQQLVLTTRAALASLADPLEALAHVVRWQTRELEPRGDATSAEPAAWLILADRGGLGESVAERLGSSGAPVQLLKRDDLGSEQAEAWRQAIAASGDAETLGIVHLWSLDDTAEADWSRRQETVCGATLALVQALADATARPRLWLVTRGAAPAAELPEPLDVGAASLWGLGSTIGLEYPAWGCTRLDLDPDGGPGELEAVLTELGEPAGEDQVAWRGEERRVARLVRRPRTPGEGVLQAPASGAFQLRAREYGVLENLALLPAPRRAPGPGEVEVEVSASALNFKDVLFALGLLRSFTGIERAPDQPLGLECAGRVGAVGEGVEGFRPGDPVLVSAPGTLASHVIAPASAVIRKPANLDPARAAGVQTVFLTALYGLVRCARLEAGQTVLIHAAAGGVGQAALQVVRRAGARVLATASPPKWPHLVAQGVEAPMNSRDLDFRAQVLERTEGRGVDVVLSSLSGEAIGASLDCLAQGGAFVDIGKIDVLSPEEVAARRADARYFTFDMAEVLGADPGLHAELLEELVGALEAGDLEPPPTRVFPLGRAAAAFGHLAQAKNIGKVVLAVPPPADAGPRIRDDRSYLVTGGLGALGRVVARGLVQAGARHLVLCGRRPPAGEVAAELEALRAQGAEVRCPSVDVTSRGALADLIADIDPPLAGVVHAAGVLDDGVLANLTWPRFQAVLAPKLAGAWHLHELTRPLPLDFFVCFGSMVSLLGARGQGSYAAANACLDALAHHRRGLGLPGLTIDWGPWSGAGMAAGTEERNRARFAEVGLTSIEADQGLAIFERLLAEPAGPPQVGVLPVTWSRYLTQFPGGPPPFLAGLAGPAVAQQREDQPILEQLRGEPFESARPILMEWMRGQLARVMGFGSADKVDPAQELLEMGIDSLLAVDLRNRLEASLAIELPATLVFDHPTLDSLVDHLTAELLAEPALDELDEELLAEIEGLTEEEAQRLLAADGDDD